MDLEDRFGLLQPPSEPLVLLLQPLVLDREGIDDLSLATALLWRQRRRFGPVALPPPLQQQRRADGGPAYSTLTGITLMVFYVFALQCVSTVAVVRRETNSWKWPLFQWVYMGLLAWGLAFVVYQGGRALGWD